MENIEKKKRKPLIDILKAVAAKKYNRGESAEIVFLLASLFVFIGCWVQFGFGYGLLAVGLIWFYLVLRPAQRGDK